MTPSRGTLLSGGPEPLVPPALPLPERLVIGVCLAAVIALAWLYLATLGVDMPRAPAGASPLAETAEHRGMVMDDMPGMKMDDMPGMAMGDMPGTEPAIAAGAAPTGSMATLSFGLLAAMWIVMMVGMMLPSASPMILMAARVGRARPGGGPRWLGPTAFALGYLSTWAGFSLLAAAAQVGLQRGVLVDHEMTIGSGPIAGGVLIAAGLYQWTPLKRVCLAKCRSPLGFIMGHWRPGIRGALRMGSGHGLYCLGCCWLLMALLFVAGVMALPWLGALAALVLIEKVAPKGEWIGRLGGVAMAGAGVYRVVAH